MKRKKNSEYNSVVFTTLLPREKQIFREAIGGVQRANSNIWHIYIHAYIRADRQSILWRLRSFLAQFAVCSLMSSVGCVYVWELWFVVLILYYCLQVWDSGMKGVNNSLPHIWMYWQTYTSIFYKDVNEGRGGEEMYKMEEDN